MSAVDMLALATEAVDSENARAVLEDAIRESGWWDDRIHFPFPIGDAREEVLALLSWPGVTGADAARVIVKALSTPKRSTGA